MWANADQYGAIARCRKNNARTARYLSSSIWHQKVSVVFRWIDQLMRDAPLHHKRTEFEQFFANVAPFDCNHAVSYLGEFLLHRVMLALLFTRHPFFGSSRPATSHLSFGLEDTPQHIISASASVIKQFFPSAYAQNNRNSVRNIYRRPAGAGSQKILTRTENGFRQWRRLTPLPWQ